MHTLYAGKRLRARLYIRMRLLVVIFLWASAWSRALMVLHGCAFACFGVSVPSVCASVSVSAAASISLSPSSISRSCFLALCLVPPSLILTFSLCLTLSLTP
eukprot:5518615-Pleurochrysis_carterae.AAC.1